MMNTFPQQPECPAAIAPSSTSHSGPHKNEQVFLSISPTLRYGYYVVSETNVKKCVFTVCKILTPKVIVN